MRLFEPQQRDMLLNRLSFSARRAASVLPLTPPRSTRFLVMRDAADSRLRVLR